jgi:hypothetical protein
MLPDLLLFCCTGTFFSIHRLIGSPSNEALMQNIKKIRINPDKLSRIGIREKCLDDATILASYSINQFGNLCPVNRIP